MCPLPPRDMEQPHRSSLHRGVPGLWRREIRVVVGPEVGTLLHPVPARDVQQRGSRPLRIELPPMPGRALAKQHRGDVHSRLPTMSGWNVLAESGHRMLPLSTRYLFACRTRGVSRRVHAVRAWHLPAQCRSQLEPAVRAVHSRKVQGGAPWYDRGRLRAVRAGDVRHRARSGVALLVLAMPDWSMGIPVRSQGTCRLRTVPSEHVRAGTQADKRPGCVRGVSDRHRACHVGRGERCSLHGLWAGPLLC